MIFDLIGDTARFAESLFSAVTNNPTAVGVCTMYNSHSTLGSCINVDDGVAVTAQGPNLGGQGHSIG